MLDVVCANPFHERHEAEPGWCARIGYREGHESGTTEVGGLFCSACAPYINAVRGGLELARRVASTHLGVVQELTKAVGLLPDEIAFLVDA